MILGHTYVLQTTKWVNPSLLYPWSPYEVGQSRKKILFRVWLNVDRFSCGDAIFLVVCVITWRLIVCDLVSYDFIYIRFLEQPSIREHPMDQVIERGGDVTFGCAASSTFQSLLIWLHNGQLLRHTHRIQITGMHNSHHVIQILT